MSRRHIVIGTKNRKKLEEMRALLSDLDCQVSSIDEIAPELPAPEETGATFAENAALKARHYADHTGLICVADDSGLEVDALDGAPGIHSARFAGPGADDAANNARLLRELAGRPEAERGAGYRCAVAVAAPGKVFLELEETCRGRILETPRGEGGFGYDPYFLFPEWDLTFAEVDRDRKAEVSHRGRALRRLHEELPAIFSIVENARND